MLMELKYQVHLILLMMLVLTKYTLNTRTLKARRNVVVNPTPIEYKQYVLVEDYTGTWCGYCTQVSYAIEQLKKETNDAVVVAIHQGSYDPLAFGQVSTMMSTFGVTGFPTAFIDRKSRWTPPRTKQHN